MRLCVTDRVRPQAALKERKRVHLYQPNDTLLALQRTRMQWASRLTHALDTHRFRLYRKAISPLGRSGQGRPRREILLRLLDETGRVIEPMVFLPAAERYNLMPAIDRWVTRATAEAINQAAHVMAETVEESDENAPFPAMLQQVGVDPAQDYALARSQPMQEAEATSKNNYGSACDMKQCS